MALNKNLFSVHNIIRSLDIQYSDFQKVFNKVPHNRFTSSTWQHVFRVLTSLVPYTRTHILHIGLLKSLHAIFFPNDWFFFVIKFNYCRIINSMFIGVWCERKKKKKCFKIRTFFWYWISSYFILPSNFSSSTALNC